MLIMEMVLVPILHPSVILSISQTRKQLKDFSEAFFNVLFPTITVSQCCMHIRLLNASVTISYIWQLSCTDIIISVWT